MLEHTNKTVHDVDTILMVWGSSKFHEVINRMKAMFGDQVLTFQCRLCDFKWSGADWEDAPATGAWERGVCVERCKPISPVKTFFDDMIECIR